MFSLEVARRPRRPARRVYAFGKPGSGRKSAAQGRTKSPVEGVWKVAEVAVPGGTLAEEGTTITNPQPGLLIVTSGYDSATVVTGGRPRAAGAPAKDPKNHDRG